MKILVRKTDNLVIHADADLRLTEGEAVGTNWLDQHFNVSNADIYEAELPANFTGGVWSYIGGVWAVVDAIRHAQILADAQKLLVPEAVTMRQARIALAQAGKLTTVNSVIAAMTGTQGDIARIEWEFSNEVKRNQPLVLALIPVLGMTSGEIDQLFITAAGL